MKRREAALVLFSLLGTGWALLGTPQTVQPCEQLMDQELNQRFDAVGDCGLQGQLQVFRAAGDNCGIEQSHMTATVVGGRELRIPEEAHGAGLTPSAVDNGDWMAEGPLLDADGGTLLLDGIAVMGRCTAGPPGADTLALVCKEGMRPLDADGGTIAHAGFLELRPSCVFTLTPIP